MTGVWRRGSAAELQRKLQLPAVVLVAAGRAPSAADCRAATELAQRRHLRIVVLVIPGWHDQYRVALDLPVGATSAPAPNLETTIGGLVTATIQRLPPDVPVTVVERRRTRRRLRRMLDAAAGSIVIDTQIAG